MSRALQGGREDCLVYQRRGRSPQRRVEGVDAVRQGPQLFVGDVVAPKGFEIV